MNKDNFKWRSSFKTNKIGNDFMAKSSVNCSKLNSNKNMESLIKLVVVEHHKSTKL